MNIKETDLYQPIYKYFSELGYKVDGEVKTLDVTATKGKELIIIELKKALNMKLLIQGAKRQRFTDLVYLAVPRPKKTYSREWNDKVYLTRRLELGLIVVSFTSSEPLVQIVHHPKPFSRKQSQRVSKRKKASIIREVAGRNNSYNVGGSKGEKLMTAYKENCLHIACCLNEFGILAPKELRKMGTGSKTLSILNKNFYGWYIRVKRGHYEISKQGKEALKQYSNLAQFYSNKIQQDLNIKGEQVNE